MELGYGTHHPKDRVTSLGFEQVIMGRVESAWTGGACREPAAPVDVSSPGFGSLGGPGEEPKLAVSRVLWGRRRGARKKGGCASPWLTSWPPPGFFTPSDCLAYLSACVLSICTVHSLRRFPHPARARAPVTEDRGREF